MLVANSSSIHANEMAHRKQTQQTQQTQQTRPRECNVCIDAGKTPEEYTSHRVRDRSGNVVCPTLLNQKCLMCGNFGHTSSYCKNTNTMKAAPTTATKATTVTTATIVSVPRVIPRPASSNKYAILALMDQNADLSDAPFPPLEKKPEITRPATATTAATSATAAATSASLGSWASRINSHPPQPPRCDGHLQREQIVQQKTRRPAQASVAVSWADQC